MKEIKTTASSKNKPRTTEQNMRVILFSKACGLGS